MQPKYCLFEPLLKVCRSVQHKRNRTLEQVYRVSKIYIFITSQYETDRLSNESFIFLSDARHLFARKCRNSEHIYVFDKFGNLFRFCNFNAF